VGYDFANILFAGPCNARCPFCIGRQIDPRLSVNNLDEFPPRSLERFVEMIQTHAIKQVVFTGTTTDPQLYRHEARLLDHLRARLPGDTQYAVHTNGRLALKKLYTFNLYDRACLSFPTFDPVTYQKMMGVRGVPDLAQIVDRARIPVKVSCVVNEHNQAEIPAFLARCHAIGLKRLVLRRLYGDTRPWDSLADKVTQKQCKAVPYPYAVLKSQGVYHGNPVYDYFDMEVTHWDFDQCECRSINLFSNGTISDAYLLMETRLS
jgi:molybdenum cofactor biosynthesis enzyme MoaA